METVIGKILYGQDNDSYMLNEFDEYAICEKCGNPLEKPVNKNFRLKRRKYDVTATYDGYWIVSKEFKRFCEENNFFNLDFLAIPREKEYFVFRSLNIIELDHKRRKTIFDEYCDLCKRHSSIAGSSPNFYKNNEQIVDNTIYRSDVEYGYKKEQHPILLINLEVYKIIKKEKFKGLYFNNILL